jgi:hypothetical protein
MGVGESVEVGLVVMGQVEGVWTNRFAVRGEEADGEQGTTWWSG